MKVTLIIYIYKQLKVFGQISKCILDWIWLIITVLEEKSALLIWTECRIMRLNVRMMYSCIAHSICYCSICPAVGALGRSQNLIASVEAAWLPTDVILSVQLYYFGSDKERNTQIACSSSSGHMACREVYLIYKPPWHVYPESWAFLRETEMAASVEKPQSKH